MITISGREVFDKNLLTTDSVIKIWYGFHSLLRLEERCKGSLLVKPQMVKINRHNVVKGYIEDSKLNKFIIKIDYSRDSYLYLVLTDSYYIPNTYFAKSLWFRDKHFKRNSYVPDNFCNIDSVNRNQYNS